MSKKQLIAHSILWAAAVLSSALVGAPVVLTLVLLPALAVGALLIARTKAQCAS